MKEYIGLNSNIDYMSEWELKERYGFSNAFLNKFFPQPIILKCTDPTKDDLRVWKTKDVEKLLLDKNLQSAYEGAFSSTNDRETRLVRDFLKSYDLSVLSKTISNPNRKFTLHVGPTNSGKTYNAIQSLKKAGNGIYLGPLRLLALEIFDTLNEEGFPCNLLTGQEHEYVPSANLTSSTIELCDFDEHYDVAVIDEAQLIADSFRGDRWTRTLFQINADEVHVCLAPEALNLIVDMINIMGCEYTIDLCERKTPLVFSGVFKDLKCAQPGDALIAFSRKSVLAIAAELEKAGIKTSVLYGSLPPKARRNEVEKFTSGMTQVVVATDAIGMGVSLPIKRVIFCETTKFDGLRFRHLRNYEIKQIAGRAGRFGKYPVGEVLTMEDSDSIQSALKTPCQNIEKFMMPFPIEVFEYSNNIELVLSEWERLFPCEKYRRKNMQVELILFKRLSKKIRLKSSYNEIVFKLITSPFDTKQHELINYWISCCEGILALKDLKLTKSEERCYTEFVDVIPYPDFDMDTLEGCELQYKALDLMYLLSRRFNLTVKGLDEKDRLCDEINRFLLLDKDKYLLRCERCGRRISFTEEKGLCDKCYRKLNENRVWYNHYKY